jgi:hypothetical protein
MRFRHMECIIREAIEIELHPDCMNKEEGFSLSKSWKPLLQTLKERNKAPLSEGILFSGSLHTAPMRLTQYQSFSGPFYTPSTLLPVHYTTSPCIHAG